LSYSIQITVNSLDFNNKEEKENTNVGFMLMNWINIYYVVHVYNSHNWFEK